MKEQLVEQVRDVAVEILQAQAREALTHASEAITNRERAQSDSPGLFEKIDLVCERFGKFLRLNFDALIKPSVSKFSLLGAASLSLADEEDLEVANMLEGMVGYCRNLHMKEYLAFTTRFGALFYDARIDETNNPLDPEQICRAFSDSLLPLKLLPRHQHPIYQRFNQLVLRHLDKTLEKASQVLVEKQVKPSLDVYVRSRDTVFGKRKGRRPVSNPLERAFDVDGGQYSMDSEASLSELFSTIQQCLGGEGTTSRSSNLSRLVTRNEQGMLLSVPARPLADKVSVENAIRREGLITLRVPSGNKPVGGFHLRRLSREELQESVITNAQRQASSREQSSPDNGEQASIMDLVCDCLLEQKKSSVLLGIDPQVRQDVEILALFFQAIDEDAALAEPLKALVNRTRVAALKLILADKDFFSRDTLPLADLVNEIGDTGFAWTDPARLQCDATYLKLAELVDRLNSAIRVDGNFIISLLEELKTFRSGNLAMATESAEQQNRVQLVRQVARRKLQERIPGELDPVVDEILNTHFLKFMEKLLLREGAGGNSWKYVIDTVEKLLWTLRKDKEPGDRSFFEKINPRIKANLEKVLQSVGVSQDEITTLLDKLLQLQLDAFAQAERIQRDQTAMETARQVFDQGNSIEVPLRSDSDPQLAKAFIAENPDYLQQVDKLPVGTWVEFTVPGEANARCTLAGRMADGSELYFVSQHGVRMIEKSRIGLARELKDGTAKMVGEWPLFNRTLESVIATLRQRSSQQSR